MARQIDDFPPRKSIVVTPSKMAAYYASHAIDKEPHPLPGKCNWMLKVVCSIANMFQPFSEYTSTIIYPGYIRNLAVNIT